MTESMVLVQDVRKAYQRDSQSITVLDGINLTVPEGEFVALRETRDRRLSMPKLILHSLQVNIRGGRLPKPENNGRRYLKIPLDALDAPWDG